jgi:hypothetical protein
MIYRFVCIVVAVLMLITALLINTAIGAMVGIVDGGWLYLLSFGLFFVSMPLFGLQFSSKGEKASRFKESVIVMSSILIMGIYDIWIALMTFQLLSARDL